MDRYEEGRIVEKPSGCGVALWGSLLVCAHSAEHGPFWKVPRMAV